MLDLKAIKATPKTGNEKLKYQTDATGYTLLDYWRWSSSNILSNASRGMFAEFIVGTAIGLNPKNLRDERAAYDLTTEDGIKIEIKSSAYIQSWTQTKYSTISFSIKKARYWDEESIDFVEEPKRHADLYVFCLLKHKDQSTIDPLKLEQWEFYVLPTYELDNYERSQSSITINSLRKLTEGIEYKDLKSVIKKAFKEQKKSK